MNPFPYTMYKLFGADLDSDQKTVKMFVSKINREDQKYVEISIRRATKNQIRDFKKQHSSEEWERFSIDEFLMKLNKYVYFGE